ncbi:DUF2645 family protein [Salmonella enterica]|nr:DUF2645 family protein [Salmonella enterica]
MNKFNFLKPFYYIYYFLCFFIIWFLSFIDDTDVFGDDSVHHFCDIINNDNTESLRSATIPVSFLLILPFILHAIYSIKRKMNIKPLIMAIIIVAFWAWTYFIRYIRCY